MAQKGKKTITFDVVANTKQAEADVKSLSSEVAKLEDKDGKLVYQVKVDGEKQLLEFDQLIGKYNAEGKNSLVVTFDENATKASLGQTEDAIKTGMQEIVNIIKKYMNIGSIVDNTFGKYDIGSQMDTYRSKVTQVLTMLDQAQKKANEKNRLFKKEFEDTLTKVNDNPNDKKAAAKLLVLNKYNKEAYGLNEVGTGDNFYDKQIIDDLIKQAEDLQVAKKSILSSINEIQNKFGDLNENEGIANFLKNQRSALQKYLKGGFVSEKDLDLLLSDFSYKNIKDVISNANKNVNNDLRYESLTSFDVSTDDIDNIRQKITQGLQNIQITVDVNDDQIDKIRRKLEDNDVYKYEEDNADIVSYYDAAMKQGHNNILKNINEIFSKYGEVNENLSNDDQKQLAALITAYNKKGFTYNKDRAFGKNINGKKISKESFFGNFDSIMNDLQTYINEKESGIKIDVTLEPKSVTGETLRQQIENQLQNLKVTVENIEGLDKAMFRAVNTAFDKSYSDVVSKSGYNILEKMGINQKTDYVAEFDAKKSIQAAKKRNKTTATTTPEATEENIKTVKDASEKINSTVKNAKKPKITYGITFSPSLDTIVDKLESVNTLINGFDETEKKKKIVLSIYLNNSNSEGSVQGALDGIEKITKNPNNNVIVGVSLNTEDIATVQNQIRNITEKDDNKIHIKVDNIDDLATELKKSIEGAISEAFKSSNLNELVNKTKTDIKDKLVNKDKKDDVEKKEIESSKLKIETKNNGNKTPTFHEEIVLDTNAQEVEEEFKGVYDLLLKIMNAFKSGNTDLGNSLIGDLEDLMEEEYQIQSDLRHNTDVVAPLKDGRINGAISRLQEIYDIDIPYVETQVQKVEDVINTGISQVEANPIEIEVRIKNADKAKEIVNEIFKYTKDNNMNGISGEAYEDYSKSLLYSRMGKMSDSEIKEAIKIYKYYDKEFSRIDVKKKRNDSDIQNRDEYYKYIQDEKNALEASIFTSENPEELKKIFGKRNESLFNDLNSEVERIKANVEKLSPIIDKINEFKKLIFNQGEKSFPGKSLFDFLEDGDVERLNNYIDKLYKVGEYAEEVKQKQDNSTNGKTTTSEDKITSKEKDTDITFTIKTVPDIDELKAKIESLSTEDLKTINIKLGTGDKDILAELNEVVTKLNELNGKNVSIGINDEDLAALKTLLNNDNNEDAKTRNIDINSNAKDIIADITNLNKELSNIPESKDITINLNIGDSNGNDIGKDVEQAVNDSIDKINVDGLGDVKIESIKNLKDYVNKISETFYDGYDDDKGYAFGLERSKGGAGRGIRDRYGENIKASKKSIKDAIKSYNEHIAILKKKKEEYKELANLNGKDSNSAIESEERYKSYIERVNDDKKKLFELVNSYNDVNDVKDLFGKKNEGLFNEIVNKIPNAKKAAKSIINRDSYLGSISGIIKEITGSYMNFGQSEKLEKNIQLGGVKSGYEYLKQRLGIDVPGILSAVEELERTKSKANTDVNKTSNNAPIQDNKNDIKSIQNQINSLQNKDITIKPVIEPSIESIQNQINTLEGKDVNIGLKIDNDDSPAKKLDTLIDNYFEASRNYAREAQYEATGIRDYTVTKKGNRKKNSFISDTEKEAANKANDAKEILSKASKELYAIEEEYFNFPWMLPLSDMLPNENDFFDELLNDKDIDKNKIKSKIREEFGIQDVFKGDSIQINLDASESIANISNNLNNISKHIYPIVFDAKDSIAKIQTDFQDVFEKSSSSKHLSSLIAEQSNSGVKEYWKNYSGLLARKNEEGKLDYNLNKYLTDGDINKSGTSTKFQKLSAAITALKNKSEYAWESDDLFNRAAQLLSGFDESTLTDKTRENFEYLKNENTYIFDKLNEALNKAKVQPYDEMKEIASKTGEIINKAISMSKKDANKINKDELTNQYLDALSKGGFNDAIETLNNSLDIKLPTEEITESLSDGMTVNLSSVATVINNLTQNDIPKFGTSFETAANDIKTQTDRIKTSISSIKDIVNEVTKSLSKAGLTDVNHLKGYEKELKTLEKERKKLAEDRKKAEEKITAAKTKADDILAKAQEKANKQQQKQSKSLQKQSKDLQKKQDELDAQTTQTNTIDRNKQLLEQAVGKTKDFTIDSSTITRLEDGTISFAGELKNANGEIVKMVYNYQKLSDIITKSGSLQKKFLNSGTTEEELARQAEEKARKEEERVRAQAEAEAAAIAAQQKLAEEQAKKEAEAAKKTTVKYPLGEYTGDRIIDPATIHYVDQISKIKEAASKTKLFDLDENSIEFLNNGMIQFNATIDAGTEKAKNLRFVISDIAEFLNKNGSFSMTSLKKAGKSEEEIAKELEQAKQRQEKLDEMFNMSSTFDDNRKRTDLTDLQKRTNNILDAENTRQKYNFNLEDGEEPIYLNESEIQSQKDLLNDLLKYAKLVGNEFDNIDFTKLNVDKNGIVSVLSSIKNVNGETEETTYKFSSILGMINEINLSLDRVKFSESVTKMSGITNTDNELQKLTTTLKDLIVERKIYDETVNNDSQDVQESKKLEYLKKEVDLYQQLIALAEKRGKSEGEINNLKKDLYDFENTNLKDMEGVNLFTPNDRSGDINKAINAAKRKFVNLFYDISDKSGIDNLFLDKMINFNGIDTTVKKVAVELRESLIGMFNNLDEGVFKDQKALQSYLATINDLLGLAKELKSDKYTNKNKFGDSLRNPSELSNAEKSKWIYDQFKAKYGSGGLRVSAYDDNNGATVEYNDDGVLKRVIVTLNEYASTSKKAAKSQEELAEAVSEADTAIKNEADSSTKANVESPKVNDVGDIKDVNREDYIDEAVIKTSKPKTVRKYQSAGQKWIDGVKAKIQNLTQYVTGIDIVMRIWNEIQQGFSFVKEFDSSLTTINQTMNTTIEELNNLGKGAINAGKNLGSTAEDVLDAAAIYANANETAESVLEKAKPTMLLANASGAESSTAADQIQGVIEQFKELEGQETRVVNSYEKISSGLAIDFAKGINIMSEGVQTAGSVVEEAGMKFETYAASVGKISERTRLEGSTIGNAYKTIMARLSRSKSADEDVTAADRSNAAKAYKTIGIDLYDQNGQYKDINETLDELASKWNSLTDAQRNYISEQSAGVRNINTFNALIETWQESSALAQSALEDTDYYMSVQEKHMASMQGKFNSLRASMEGVWNSLLDTGTLNTGIDLLNLLAQAVQGVIDVFASLGNITGTGALPSALGLGGLGIFGTALFGNIKEQKELALKQWEEEVAQAVQSGLSSDEIAEKYKRPSGFFKSGFKETLDDMKRLGLKQMQDNGSAGFTSYWQAFKAGAVDANGAITNLGAGIKNVWANMTGLSKAVVGFSAAAIALGVVVKLFDAITDSSEETAQKVTEAMDAYNKGQEDLRNKKSSLDSISAEWHQLSKGVDSNGNNISLTNEEFARYHELCNQIADILPSTVSGFDSQGNAILNLTGKVSELNAEYDKLALNQAKTDLNSLKDIQNDYNNKIDNKKWTTEVWDTIAGGWKAFKNGGPVLGYQVSYEEALKELEKVNEMNAKELQDYYVKIGEQGNGNAAASWVYSEDGLDLAPIFQEGINDENWAAVKTGIQTKIQEVEGVVEGSVSNYRKMLQAQLKVLTLDKDEYPEYSNLDDSIINNINSLLDSLPQDKLEEFGRNTAAAKTYVEDVLNAFTNNKDYQTSLSNILNINEDTSIEDLENIIKNDLSKVQEALKLDDDAQLKVALKLDGADELIQSYRGAIIKANAISKKEGKKLLENADAIRGEDTASKVDITIERDENASKTGKQMQKAGWNIGKNEMDSYFAQTKQAGGKTFVLTPITPDGKEVLSPGDLDKYLQDEVLKGMDSKNLLLGEFDGDDQLKKAKKFSKELTNGSKKFNKSADKIKDFIEREGINTEEEIRLLKSLMDKYDNWSDVMANWGAESFDLDVNADSLDALESNLDIVKETISNIQSAYKESITSSGMTKETIENIIKAFSDLDGYNYDNLFESTASGVHMNAQELAKMNAQYEKHEKAKYEDKLKEEIKSYEDICQAIEEANTLSEKQALIRKRDGLAEQIQRTNELISRYEGLTNAVTKYQQALEMGEEGDVYDSIVSGYENAKTLWEKGLVGTNEFKAFTQMFSNEDLTGKGVEAYVNAWQAAQGKMTRWLSEGGEGVENFLYDIRALNSEWAKLDANGNWNLDGLPDMKTLAKNLGISESLIDQMMRKLHDYGFEINFSEAKDNLRYMLQDAKEINKQFGQFSQFGLNDDDLKKVTSDAEQLQKMKEFKFNLEVSDPKALDEQISIAGKLRTALVDAFGNGSEEVEKFDKQLDYLKAKRGELTDVSTLAKEGYSLGLDFTKDKEALDDIIEKLMTIKGFSNMNINLEMNTIDDVNNNLDILTGKINNLARDGNGKVDLSADGAAEALELYSALIAKKREFDLTETSIYKFDSTKLKTGAQQNAIEYLQAFQKVSSELQNAYDVNKVFGAGTIDVKPLETNMLNALDKIKNSGEDVQEIFKNLGFDISDISKANIDDYVSLMNYVNAQIRDIGSTDVAGISGTLTDKIEARTNDLKELKQKAEYANKILKDNYYEGLNLDVDSLDGIKEQINQGEWLMKTLDKDSESAKALQKQLDYLNQKKLFQESSFSGDLNLDLNYTDNKEKIDEIVTSLTSIDTYKNLEIDFKVKDPDDIDGQITNISKELEKLKDPKTGKIDFTQEGASELMDTMIALYNQKQLLTNEHRSYMNVDTSGATDAQKSALGNVQQLQNSMDQLNKIEFMKKFVPDIDTSAAQKAVADAWKEIQNGTEEEKRIYANLGIEPDKIKVDSDEINDETQKAIQGELDPIDCEVLVNAGYDIKTVDKLTEDLDYLKDEYNVDIDIDWESLSPEYIEDKIEDLKGQLKDLRGEDGIIKIGEEGYDQARELMLSLIKMKQQAEGNVVLSIDTSQLEGETQKAITDLQEVMNAYQQLQALKDLQAAGVEVDTSELDAAQTKLDGLVADFANSHPETAATVGLTIKEGDEAKIVSDVNAALAGITADMMVKAGVDSTLVDGYSPEDKDATVTYNVNKAAVTTFLNSNIDRTATVTYNIKTVGSVPGGPGQLNGTAHLNGTAYANGTTGNWGAKKTETALVGEVAPELRVNSKTGRWELLGEHGAEFAKINKGDVIFNHKILWSYTAMCMYKFI